MLDFFTLLGVLVAGALLVYGLFLRRAYRRWKADRAAEVVVETPTSTKAKPATGGASLADAAPDATPRRPDSATAGSGRATHQPGETIFLCYRRGDSPDVTGRIKDHLVAQFGRDAVFTDVDGIPLGVDFRTHLDAVVSRCRVFLAVVGRDWFGGEADTNRLEDPGDFVRIEIESALKREIPVIPVLVRGASMPNEAELPESLAAFAYRNGTRVRPDPDFSSDIARVISGLERHLRG